MKVDEELLKEFEEVCREYGLDSEKVLNELVSEWVANRYYDVWVFKFVKFMYFVVLPVLLICVVIYAEVF
ncbi:MAG: hypothetical protein DRO14_00235 [Thermoprotei archaeon]|nr:MAG: hypothetical protein DRO14_00200 [Thermoprotei archaeon]RLG78576.1 MAG: hypothetical protein DRO14_00235 [Thermoprotei archaeon]